MAGVTLTALGWLWRTWVPIAAVVAAAVCVAGVAVGDINCHFAWQAWHLVTSTFVLRGKCWHLRHWKKLTCGVIRSFNLFGDPQANPSTVLVSKISKGDGKDFF